MRDRAVGGPLCILTLALFGFIAPVCGQENKMQSGPPTADRWAILVSGLSGDEELQKEFMKWTENLHAILVDPLQFSRDQIFVLFDDPSKKPGLIGSKSTGENLERVCKDIGSRAKKGDLVLIFIVGHGNFDGKVYKLNLPGPDPTAEDLASMLYSIPVQRFVVVNATTCSGGSIAVLSHKGTILISATKSGNEKNHTHFAQFFVEAFKGGNADLDKNGRVSVLEAFNYAAQKVEEFYTREGILQTEHPVLDDDGDGQAHSKPEPNNGDGFLARTTYLDAGPPLITQRKLSPQERALALEAQDLEKQVEALKYAKVEIPEAEYEKKLESLLLRLAVINAKLRKNK